MAPIERLASWGTYRAYSHERDDVGAPKKAVQRLLIGHGEMIKFDFEGSGGER